MDPLTLATSAVTVLSPYLVKIGEKSAEEVGKKLPQGALAALLPTSAEYRAMPRDEMRAQMARSILHHHCRAMGLKAEFQGRGVPDLR
jgi:hypothetical protein